MNLIHLIDGPSAAIVFGGTALATLLRCGWSDCGATFKALRRLSRRRFNAASVQSQLAAQVQDIQRDGLLRAPAHVFGDSEFDEAAGTLIQTRSVTALLEKHEVHKARRQRMATTASQTLSQAAELAPVFGLAGTLIALSQMPMQGLTHTSYISTISMAVLTTLYGLIAANLLLAPLARAVDRASELEERERQKLIDWLALHVAAAGPRRHKAPRLDEVA